MPESISLGGKLTHGFSLWSFGLSFGPVRTQCITPRVTAWWRGSGPFIVGGGGEKRGEGREKRKEEGGKRRERWVKARKGEQGRVKEGGEGREEGRRGEGRRETSRRVGRGTWS